MEAGALTYQFLAGEGDRLVGVSVEKRVSGYEKVLPTITDGLDGANSVIAMPHLESRLHREMVEALQYIESVGSLWLTIESVDWSDASWEWVAESPEEQALLSISSANLKMTSSSALTPVSAEHIGKLIAMRPRVHDTLVVPMSFFREGANDYSNHRFVNAFINFYLYLEHMYGNGKTQNSQIEREFLGSEYFRSGISTWQSAQTDLQGVQHIERLKKFLEKRGWEYSDEKIVRLLVRMRGEAHHSSRTSNKPQGNPFNHADYYTPAWLCMGLCVHSITRILDRLEVPK